MLSGQHRADYYFREPESDEGILRVRRGDKAFWDYIDEVPIPENIMRYIRLAGFAGVIECGYRKLDRALISALVDRWRPETHTFHLPVGETTITLQDVQVLWGLPVEDNVVSGTDFVMSTSEIIMRFEYLTGCTLATNAFNWRPYDNIIHLLPDICTSGYQSWRSDTYLICWELVEPHIPSRVLRQFGMFQPIPTSVLLTREQHINLHSIARKGGRNKNWLQHHNIFVQAWASRHNLVANEPYTDSPIASEAYMRWYLERTVVYTTNPAHQDTNPRGFQNDGQRLRMMMDGMSQFYQRPGDETGRNMASRYMEFAYTNHISYLPTHVTQNVDDTQLPPVTQRLRRRGRGRGWVGRQVVDDNVEQQNMIEQRDSTEQQFDSPFLSQMSNPDFFTVVPQVLGFHILVKWVPKILKKGARQILIKALILVTNNHLTILPRYLITLNFKRRLNQLTGFLMHLLAHST